MDPETSVRRGANGEDFVILACIVLIELQSVTDGHTHRQTVRQTLLPYCMLLC